MSCVAILAGRDPVAPPRPSMEKGRGAPHELTYDVPLATLHGLDAVDTGITSPSLSSPKPKTSCILAGKTSRTRCWSAVEARSASTQGELCRSKPTTSSTWRNRNRFLCANSTMKARTQTAFPADRAKASGAWEETWRQAFRNCEKVAPPLFASFEGLSSSSTASTASWNFLSASARLRGSEVLNVDGARISSSLAGGGATAPKSGAAFP
mmetsp:Transcript_1544/g.3511  ORF Transcript_1544/g.3511 Transcript_1544/m.3511 type:complete len:210 (-) Transcript_1544:196-825(-)